MEQEANKSESFATLRSVDVNQHVEKKNGLSYLSWAWAVDQLLLRDPSATWSYRWGKDPAGSEVPLVYIGETAMVFCTVHAFGVSRTAQLPVMNHRNQPIPQPDSFQVNTAMQRCLAKAIALHGLGLYIYSGEDLPPEDKGEIAPTTTAEELQAAKDSLARAKTIDELRGLWTALADPLREATKAYTTALAKKLTPKAA